MQYLLTRPHPHSYFGVQLAAGTVLSTDAPQHSLYYIAPDEADKLLADGILAPDTTPVLTGARDQEPGWHPLGTPRERSEQRVQEGT